jgi:hypothetical protein
MTTDGGLAREGGPDRRRRRRRATSAQGAPQSAVPAPPTPAAAPLPGPGAQPHPPAPAAARSTSAPARGKSPRRRRSPRESGERGLRDLVGSGPSQLGVSGALRGRDVNRPTDEDIAEAQRDLVIVRRHWQPTDKP